MITLRFNYLTKYPHYVVSMLLTIGSQISGNLLTPSKPTVVKLRYWYREITQFLYSLFIGNLLPIKLHSITLTIKNMSNLNHSNPNNSQNSKRNKKRKIKRKMPKKIQKREENHNRNLLKNKRKYKSKSKFLKFLKNKISYK